MVNESADWAFIDSVGDPEYGMGEAGGGCRKEKYRAWKLGGDRA